jgi:hypothetical protein
MHSWKSFTAHEINKSTGGTGAVWQKESYDHLVRDGEDLRNQVAYVLDNPKKAGLSGWKWVGCVFEDFMKRRELLRDAATTVFTPSYDPFSYERRRSSPLTIMGHDLGGENTVRVFTTQEKWNALAQDFRDGRFQAGDHPGEIRRRGNRSE